MNMCPDSSNWHLFNEEWHFLCYYNFVWLIVLTFAVPNRLFGKKKMSSIFNQLLWQNVATKTHTWGITEFQTLGDKKNKI